MILTTMMCVSTDTSNMKMVGYTQDATMTENFFKRRLNHAFSFQVSTTQHRDALMVTTMNPGGREMMNLVKNMEMEHINVLVAAPGNISIQDIFSHQ